MLFNMVMKLWVRLMKKQNPPLLEIKNKHLGNGQDPEIPQVSCMVDSEISMSLLLTRTIPMSSMQLLTFTLHTILSHWIIWLSRTLKKI